MYPYLIYKEPPKPSIGQELLNVPMGTMIQQMGFAIAEAQFKLDSNSIQVAQMLGGLKTITTTIDGKEVISFQDSRVFFGKEKQTYKDAIEIYNSTNDIELKVRIRQGLGDNNWEFDCVKTNCANLDALSKSGDVTTDLYRVYSINTTPVTYYTYKGTVGNTKQFEKTDENNVPIKKKGALADNSSIYIPSRVSMLELGFSPTFYQFVDTIIEVKINITITENKDDTNESKTKSESGFGGGLAKLFGGPCVARTSQTNATHSQKYSYSAEGSSLLRTKLVPIPPPAILEERIRNLMAVAKEEGVKNNETPAPAPAS